MPRFQLANLLLTPQGLLHLRAYALTHVPPAIPAQKKKAAPTEAEERLRRVIGLTNAHFPQAHRKAILMVAAEILGVDVAFEEILLDYDDEPEDFSKFTFFANGRLGIPEGSVIISENPNVRADLRKTPLLVLHTSGSFNPEVIMYLDKGVLTIAELSGDVGSKLRIQARPAWQVEIDPFFNSAEIALHGKPVNDEGVDYSWDLGVVRKINAMPELIKKAAPARRRKARAKKRA